MSNNYKNKILPLEELIEKVSDFKKKKKIVVQSHGIFDLIHPGLIAHLDSAKKQGDILIITVIRDRDVRRGPGRPIFPEKLRAENIASCAQVDYVAIVGDETPFECIAKINPDVFAKGKAYKDRDSLIHKKIFEEEKNLHLGQSKIYETPGFTFSSSEIIKNFLDIYPQDVQVFLSRFSKKYGFRKIVEAIEHLNKLKILIVGDGIIDEYHYCQTLGKSAKAQIIVNKYLTHEVFAGGVFAIANHMAGLCRNVHLVSLLGKESSRKDFILENIRPNVKVDFFTREDGPTITKKRYIDQYLNQKLFEINYLNDDYIHKDLEDKVLRYLANILSEADIVLVSDFGHGFITQKIIRLIEKASKKYAVNTQTNGANAGFNMVTKYRRPAYTCLDETELRLSAQDKHSAVEPIAIDIARAIHCDYLIVTRGRNGSVGIEKGKKINRTPAFSTKVVDTVGAGDAFFAFTAPCVAQGMPLDLISFIGNAVGALAVQIVGNKRSVEKHEFLEFIHTLLK